GEPPPDASARRRSPAGALPPHRLGRSPAVLQPTGPAPAPPRRRARPRALGRLRAGRAVPRPRGVRRARAAIPARARRGHGSAVAARLLKPPLQPATAARPLRPPRGRAARRARARYLRQRHAPWRETR